MRNKRRIYGFEKKLVGIRRERFEVLSRYSHEETEEKKETSELSNKKPNFVSFLSQILLYQIISYLAVPENRSRVL